MWSWTTIEEMEQQIAGVLLGAGAMFAGYLISKVAESQRNEVDYLSNVPQYRNLGDLKTDLEKLPSQRADVLVEGIVRKQTSSLSSKSGGVEGAARLITTTDFTKVYDSQNGVWNNHSSSTENSRLSVPFNLTDPKGGKIVIESVHQAGGFRSLLQQVYQERTKPDHRTIGDFATTLTVNELPNGSLKRELMLLFGTSFAGYGQAMLVVQQSSPEVVFLPSEVSTTIHGLLSRKELVVSGLKFLSLVLIVGGGALVIFAAIPFLRKFYNSSQETTSSSSRRRQIEQ